MTTPKAVEVMAKLEVLREFLPNLYNQRSCHRFLGWIDGVEGKDLMEMALPTSPTQESFELGWVEGRVDRRILEESGEVDIAIYGGRR